MLEFKLYSLEKLVVRLLEIKVWHVMHEINQYLQAKNRV
jgi:hypothetical protein